MLETGLTKPSFDVLIKLEDLFHMNHRKLFGAARRTRPKKIARTAWGGQGNPQKPRKKARLERAGGGGED